jgi:hypothetical protein
MEIKFERFEQVTFNVTCEDPEYPYQCIKTYPAKAVPEEKALLDEIQSEYDKWLAYVNTDPPEPTKEDLEKQKAQLEREKVWVDGKIAKVITAISSKPLKL